MNCFDWYFKHRISGCSLGSTVATIPYDVTATAIFLSTCILAKKRVIKIILPEQPWSYGEFKRGKSLLSVKKSYAEVSSFA